MSIFRVVYIGATWGYSSNRRQVQLMVALIRDAWAARGYAFEIRLRDTGSVTVHAVWPATSSDPGEA
jgi:hypothetical protein